MKNNANLKKVTQYSFEHHNKLQKSRPTLGLLIEHTLDMENGYLPTILAGADKTSREEDVNLLCFTGGSLNGFPLRKFDEQRNILYELVSNETVDGLVILSSLGHYAPFTEFQEFHKRYYPLPTVSVGAYIPDTPSILVDNEKGLRDALVHLIERHDQRRIAFICGPEENPEAQTRYRVYTEVLANYNISLDPDLVASGDFNSHSGIEAIRLFLDQRQTSFGAVVAANDMMALGALGELETRGIYVPNDVALIGFDDIRPARIATPSLTTIRQPIFELGRQSVEMVLAQLAGETVPKQTTFPTELVIRRSCGCLEPAVVQVSSQLKAHTGELLSQKLPIGQESIQKDLSSALKIAGVATPGFNSQLLEGFHKDVKNGLDHLFLSVIESGIRQTIREGREVGLWQEVIMVLRHHLKMLIRNDDLLQAEILLQQAQVFIREESMKVQKQHRLMMERQNMALNAIGQTLITTFDTGKLIDIVAENMPSLSIPSCYLALYEETRPYKFPEAAPEWSQLVLASNEKERLKLEPEESRFRSRRLMPEGLLPQNRRYTMMIMPLHFQDEQIGYALFERGPQEGNIYETLRGQISSALKGAFLLKTQKQAEEVLRQHRDDLDNLVQERTAQLAISNEHLKMEIAERRWAEEALRESEENLRATLHSIGDAVLATDKQGNIVWMNPIAEKLTGWTFSEAKDRPLAEVFNIINAQTLATAVSPVEKVLETGEIVGLANHTMLIAKNNTTYQIADSAAPIRDNNQTITGVVLVFRDVTEEHRIQKALKARETQLLTIIETVPDLIWLKDPDGVFLICNSKVGRYYGEKASGIVGKTDYDFVDEELADHFQQKDREAIAAGKPTVNEEEVTFADDGHKEIIETIKTPVYDAEGKLIGVLGISRDISERKRTEEEIRDSKQMLSNVLNTIPVRVFWKDLNGNFLGCNQLFAQDVGKNNPEEVVGTNDYDLSSVDQADLYRSDDKYIIESEQPKINYEEPQTTADGTLAWLNTSKIPLRNSNGVIYGVLGIYEDITERKRAEQLLKESNERLQLALQTASMGTWEWDIVNNHILWSPEIFNIFGIQRDAFVGTYEAYLAFVAPHGRKEVDETIKQFLADGQQASVIQYEHEIMRGDGKAGWIEMRGALFLGDEDQPLRMMGVCADVTDRKEVAVQLEAYTAELERSNRELQEFAYVASHDLQEPLRKIQTFGDRLQQKYSQDVDEKGQIYIKRMQSAAARMQTLIVDLLTFSRVRTHAQPFDVVDLQQTFAQVLQDLEIRIIEVSADITVKALPTIEADAFQMMQLFQNLLSNALKFHRPDVPLEIIVRSRMAADFHEILVVDNGIGFEEKYLDRIFIVFERLHGRDSYPGTGVGLAICRRIVERHGGYIHAESQLGKGATFIIGLPINQPIA